jgi:lipopolysaccharide export system permease protein
MKRLTIIDRYLAREFFGPFMFSVGGFLIIGLMDFIFALVDLFINANVPLSVVARLLVYKIPEILVLFLPMSTLFSTMLLLVRMAKDSEITIVRTSGISLFRIIIPLMALGLGTGLFSLAVNEYVAPWTNQVSDRLIQYAVRKQPPPKIASNVFFKERGNRFLYIETIDMETGDMQNLLMFEKKNSAFPTVLTAQRAQWDQNEWHLFNGFIQEFNPSGDVKYVSQFDTTTIHVKRDLGAFYNNHKTPRQMDSSELKERIDVMDSSGVNTAALEIEYYLKQSLPMACFIFGLMGITFCVVFVKTSKDWWGVIWAIVTVVLLVGLYFFLMAVCKAIGKQGIIDPFLCAWFPNIVYFFPCIGILLYDGYTR